MGPELVLLATTVAASPAHTFSTWQLVGASDSQATAERYIGACPMSTMRGLAPSAGPTSPSVSMRSTRRAARL